MTTARAIADAPAHAARKFARETFPACLPAPRSSSASATRRRHFLRRAADRALVQQRIRHVIFDGQRIEKRALLEQHADLAADLEQISSRISAMSWPKTMTAPGVGLDAGRARSSAAPSFRSRPRPGSRAYPPPALRRKHPSSAACRRTDRDMFEFQHDAGGLSSIRH